LRDVAERAVEQGDAMKAWTGQYLALLHGADLTMSMMRACHDGGQQDGQFPQAGAVASHAAGGGKMLRCE
jgi:hypothetical protein